MKKIILLFAVALSVCITSCQTDDDNAGPADTQDKFIGIWKLVQLFEDDLEVTLSDCDKRDTLIINPDQTFSWKIYERVNGICQLEDNEAIEGAWENLGDDTYKITPELEVSESQEAKVTFSENRMTLEFNDDGEIVKQIFVSF